MGDDLPRFSGTAYANCCDLVVVNQEGGKDQEDGMFTVKAAQTVTDMAPEEGKGKVGEVTIDGTGFAAGAVITLAQKDQSDIAATGVQIVSDKQIKCAFNLTGKAAGSKWDLVAKVGENEGKKPEAFIVEAATDAPATPSVTDVNPYKGKVGAKTPPVAITGTGFVAGAKVELRAGEKRISAIEPVELKSGIEIQCTFDLAGKAVGEWRWSSLILARKRASRLRSSPQKRTVLLPPLQR
jgi:hypothetical protein